MSVFDPPMSTTMTTMTMEDYQSDHHGETSRAFRKGKTLDDWIIGLIAMNFWRQNDENYEKYDDYDDYDDNGRQPRWPAWREHQELSKIVRHLTIG